MSIQDTHWTDQTLSEFAQDQFADIAVFLGSRASCPLRVETFFLNPDSLGCSNEPQSLEDGVQRKLNAVLPPELSGGALPNMAQTFLGLADLAYIRDGQIHILLSRPDDSSTLAQRISSRVDIKLDDLAVDRRTPSCGFDNLELINRLFQILNSLPNGGQKKVEQMGLFGLVRFRSMLGAKRKYLEFGGDPQTIAIHEACAHIQLFTRGKISDEYFGFMRDLSHVDKLFNYAYRNVVKALVERQATSIAFADDTVTQYETTPYEKLYPALTDLLDSYESTIHCDGGKKLVALNACVSKGNMSQEERDTLKNLTSTELLETTSQYIVYKTLHGMRLLLGDNALKYAPIRSTASLDRLRRLFEPRCEKA